MDPVPVSREDPALRLDTAQGRWVVLAAILGSGMAGIDATVVNVALPAVGRDLDAPFGTLQWVVTGYALTLASFILVGGSLGDRYGRARVFAVGVLWFAAASVLCALATDATLLVAARLLQGVGGALLTPASLSVIQASFAPEDRGRAIGAWSGLGGVATAVGPFLGGWLVEAASWRWVFWINVPLAAVVVWVVRRHVPETADEDAPRRIDLAGSAAAAVSLAGLTYALIAVSSRGWDARTVGSLALGVLAAVAFVVVEGRSDHPVLPFSVFASSQFRAVNAVTLVVYGALGVVFFLLVLELQIVAGFGPVAAGTALLPVTVVMLALSARSGDLAARLGPRRQLVIGPLVCAAALGWMTTLGPDAGYVTDVLPPVLLFGLGLAALVAPLTATALSSVPGNHSGLASGVNNAVARTGGLLAVAAVPALVGLTGSDYEDPAVFDAGFDRALVISAVLLVLGAVVSLVTVRDPRPEAPGPSEGVEPAVDRPPALRHCSVADPPQRTHAEPRDG
ncbi:MFS transporter [Phycicoccus flavus]|uniref:MFS transporter n=1 Tax=Phycicoccus flavus TaxID=2502783 RepID=UPI001F32AE27|nr:MFS transporter [Phycicoccus flavus]